MQDVLKHQLLILAFSVPVLDTIKCKLFWYDGNSAILRLITKIMTQATTLNSATSLLLEIFRSLNKCLHWITRLCQEPWLGHQRLT